jgi:gamma-D-glutamyl-L-lysine dipeptidyl-peptidase
MNDTGQCLLPVIPVRAEGKSQAEIVTQLLYGETYTILTSGDEWIEISTQYDSYVGWISANQHSPLSFEPKGVAHQELLETHNDIKIPLGGGLPTKNPTTDKSTIEISKMFLGSPYLWGGRTFMGIDCSGFMQVVHKAKQIKLPRDASQQVFEGNLVTYNERQAGDLVFFKNDSNKVHHVGMLVSPDQIIHASGSVRIDKFTTEGVIHSTTGKLSHRFYQLRRLI